MRVHEVIQPSPKLQSSVLYHGTSTRNAYQGIIDHGLKYDPSLVDKKYKGSENFAPLAGVYLTTEFGNAVRYSFMSNVPDEQYVAYNEKEPYGYVFEFSGKDASGVTPDEDELGKFIEKLVKTYSSKSNIHNISNISKIVQEIPENIRTELLQRNVSYETIALAGKWAINKLSDATMQYLMKKFENIVNYGIIKPNAIWAIPKPNERFLKDRQKSFNTFGGYENYAKRVGIRKEI